MRIWERIFSKCIEISTNSSRPIAITAVDLNNDSLLDIVTANYGTHSVTVFYSHTQFQSVETFSTGADSFPTALAAADFNNDIYIDLAIVNSGTNNIQICFRKHNKTCDKQMIISTGVASQPRSIATGHLNTDDFIDLVTANFQSREILIFLNNGDGTFVLHSSLTTASASPYALRLGDFNLDQLLDIVAINQGPTNIAFFLGYGNADFETATTFETGSLFSISIDIGDFNMDHRLDLVVVNEDTGTIDISLSRYNDFPNRTTYSTGENPSSIAVADLNNDTRPDIVVANENGYGVSVLLAQGDGSFARQARYFAGSPPYSVTIGDLNNDTRPDIVVANAGAMMSVFFLLNGMAHLMNKLHIPLDRLHILSLLVI